MYKLKYSGNEIDQLLDKANSALQGLRVNDTSKYPDLSGIVDLGTVNAYPIIRVETSDTTKTICPNIFYVWDVISNLNISLDAELSDVVNEYVFQFTCGTTEATIALPENILWWNGEVPTFETNTTYQISIVNNLGVVIKFK